MTDPLAPSPALDPQRRVELAAMSQPVREAMAQAQKALAQGQMQAAQAAYKQALDADPSDPTIPFVMAGMLRRAGQAMPALSLQLTAWRMAPQDINAKLALAGAFRGAHFTQASPVVVQALLALLVDPDVAGQELAVPGLSLLRQESGLAAAMQAAADSEALALHLEDAKARKALEDALAQPLARALLGRALLADSALEAFFTTLRRYSVERLRSGAPLPLSRGALALVALQAEITGYSWAVSDAEEEALSGLTVTGSDWSDARLLHALYGRPPEGEASPDAPLAGGPDGGPLALLHQRLYLEPQREAQLMATLPRLSKGLPEDGSVFPRWITISRQPPRPFQQAVAESLPLLPASSWPEKPVPRILIAGCGTGAAAVRAAGRYAGAQLLALDANLPALAFAKRQADHLGASNLTFAQADLFDLPETLPPPGGPFDLIDCPTWLHGCADTQAGIAALAKQLAPDGFLRLGFFRRSAQALLQSLTQRLAPEGTPSEPAALRASRQTLAALDKDDPLRSLTQGPDFYHLDGFANLLGQAGSQAFSLPEIAALLETLGLESLGVEVTDRGLYQLFRQVNGAEASAQDLSLWDAIEREAPQRFGPSVMVWAKAVSAS
ncbi:MAG: class I SAM-dependent methyltransferase [Pseudomonadota bacterium]